MVQATPLRSVTPAIDIYIRLAQYPILSSRIRAQMRKELFQRGVISQEDFRLQVREHALVSQRREGLVDPFNQEEATIWQKRKDRIRDFLTDSYFAFNLGPTFLDKIIDEVLNDQPAPTSSVELTFNPEISPWELLFRQGELYEQMTGEAREKIDHHLEEIKVVLIKRMISDQLPYIGVAKKIFNISTLRRIFRRRIGQGKIGGKSAGFLLAWQILQQDDSGSPDGFNTSIKIPDSYFLGTEVIYEFRLKNGIDHLMNQKYRPHAEIREEYPNIVDAHLKGEFPENIVRKLREMMKKFGKAPIIVRSSSLLEDNFGFAFAGKYNSYFCPNQGTTAENLEDLLDAIKRVYASTLNPDALLYRQKHGLIDYDERMAVLIQRVQGNVYDHYLLPAAAGVAFSQNPFRWNPKIRRKDGFLRLVWGLGTRAVDRVANDYPRMIALSHPQLRPELTAAALRHYSQWYVDLIDLEDNKFRTLPIGEILDIDYPALRYIASMDKEDYLQEILSTASCDEDDQFVLTFNYLTKDKKFVNLMRTILQRLEDSYGLPVDVEFALKINSNYPDTDYIVTVLQCRPLSQRAKEKVVKIPKGIPQEKILFKTYGLIPDGRSEGIRYVIFVDPENYRKATTQTKTQIGRTISRLNRLLEDDPFILMGPGRWGSANIDLGVQVSYADIHNTKVLVEMSVAHHGSVPELSYGTHFFQDLVEAGIYSLPLHTTHEKSFMRWEFFKESENILPQLLPEDAALAPFLNVIDTTSIEDTCRISILMDGRSDIALGFLTTGEWEARSENKSNISSF